MGTTCHIRPVDRDQNISSGDAEQTWHPAEGLAEMAGVTEFAVRNYKLGLRAQRPQHLEALARALGVDPAALTDYRVETAHDVLEVLFRLEEGGVLYDVQPKEKSGGALKRRDVQLSHAAFRYQYQRWPPLHSRSTSVLSIFEAMFLPSGSRRRGLGRNGSAVAGRLWGLALLLVAVAVVQAIPAASFTRRFATTFLSPHAFRTSSQGEASGSKICRRISKASMHLGCTLALSIDDVREGERCGRCKVASRGFPS